MACVCVCIMTRDVWEHFRDCTEIVSGEEETEEEGYVFIFWLREDSHIFWGKNKGGSFDFFPITGWYIIPVFPRQIYCTYIY